MTRKEAIQTLLTLAKMASDDDETTIELDKAHQAIEVISAGCAACEGPGYFSETCPLPGILARVEHNHAIRRYVERCDACERYASDADALTALANSGVTIVEEAEADTTVAEDKVSLLHPLRDAGLQHVESLLRYLKSYRMKNDAKGDQ